MLALAGKEMEGVGLGMDKINKLSRETVECDLVFVGFLVFHCPLKEDAVETLKMLADSSHRVTFLNQFFLRMYVTKRRWTVHYDYG